MVKHRTSSLILVASILALATGCAKKPAARAPGSELTAGRMPRPNVHVSEDLAQKCKIQFADSDRAPRFDFDDAALLPEDRDVLEQVAKCVTEGPLKGRELSLVGRADPRGEIEYNLVLGGHRADTVRDYLAKLGVDTQKLAQTSRGELDAEGTDEDSWRRDRRVDVVLR